MHDVVIRKISSKGSPGITQVPFRFGRCRWRSRNLLEDAEPDSHCHVMEGVIPPQVSQPPIQTGLVNSCTYTLCVSNNSQLRTLARVLQRSLHPIFKTAPHFFLSPLELCLLEL